MARMRSACGPSMASVGTCESSEMSSSMLMKPREWDDRAPASRHELVAAGFGHQDRGRGRILFHLLPQTVDVRLQRVGGHTRIVAPHFLQQRLARHRLLSGTIEIAQDRG